MLGVHDGARMMDCGAAASIEQPPEKLAVWQVVVLVAIGVALWFGAALMLRYLGAAGAFEGRGTLLIYALVIPGTVPFVVLTRTLARLARDQILLGVAIVTSTATLLDGAALAAMPTMYGDAAPLVAASGAAILWGVGVGLVLGLVLSRR